MQVTHSKTHLGFANLHQGILAGLDAVNEPTSSSPPPSFNVALPSSSSISEFWPESQHFVALPHDLQRNITSQVGSIHIGFSLLLALVNFIQPRQKVYTTSIALIHHL